MAQTRAQANREIRKESLREFMAAKCTVQHAIDLVEKHEDLDPTEEHFKSRSDQIVQSFNMRMKVINKYLPDLKAQELDLTSSDGAMHLPTVIELIAKNERED